jgi:bile acid:Na+ symporter, BASS family
MIAIPRSYLPSGPRSSQWSISSRVRVAQASRSPVTADVLKTVDVDLARLLVMLLIMLVVPVAGGTLLRARHPRKADAMRPWVRRSAMLVFGAVVTLVLGANLDLVLEYAAVALVPVLITFTAATILGYGLARAWRLSTADRRAVVLEVGVQNAALAIAMAVAFFPELAGVAVTSALWGIVHLVLGPTLALGFRRAA